MYKNYIFDLYGTLADIRTNEKKDSLWRKTAIALAMQGACYSDKELKREYSLQVRMEEVRQAEKRQRPLAEIEIDLAKVWKTLYRKKGIEPAGQQIEDMGIFFRTLSLVHLCLYPGARELLDRLKRDGKAVYLLSNAQSMFTVPELKLLGIYDIFDGILLSSQAGVKKPSGSFYEQLFQKYSLRQGESVMIGNDSSADIWGACDFGIDSMYVETSQSPERKEPLPANCRILQKIGDTYVHHNENP